MTKKTTAWFLFALMTCAAVASAVARTNIKPVPNILDKAIPTTFGGWKEVDQGPQIIDPVTKGTIDKIYQETLSRTYISETGYPIMLSLAHSANQVGPQEAHPPAVCYAAQGFTILGDIEVGSLVTAHGLIEVSRLKTSMRARAEPVTYWMTMADHVVRTQWDKRKVQFEAVRKGQPPDGFLFRVSSIDPDADHAFAEQQKFVADLMASVSPEARLKLSGLP